MAESKDLLIENRARDTKDLGKIIVDGKESHVILGSSDDRDGAPLHRKPDGSVAPGTSGQWNKDFPAPQQSVPANVWRAYMDDKARGPMIRDWLNSGELTIDGRRQ